MKFIHLLSIFGILAATSIGWGLLSAAVDYRSQNSDAKLCMDVKDNWGPPLTQAHPRIYYASPTNRKSVREIQPASTQIDIDLKYDPR